MHSLGFIQNLDAASRELSRVPRNENRGPLVFM